MLAAAVPVQANSIITWSAPQNISGDSDVSTAGTLVGAFNLGGPQHPFWSAVADTTVNGVTFAGLPVNGTSVTAGNFTLAGLYSHHSIGGDNAVLGGRVGFSSSYIALLASVAAGPGLTLTMNGLQPGVEYLFQWWSNNTLGSPWLTIATDSFNMEMGLPAGKGVGLWTAGGLHPGPNGLQWSPGQFATGSFVADATMVETVYFWPPGYSAYINGFQLRQISPVPDNTCSLILFAIGLLGLAEIGRKIRRQKA